MKSFKRDPENYLAETILPLVLLALKIWSDIEHLVSFKHLASYHDPPTLRLLKLDL